MNSIEIKVNKNTKTVPTDFSWQLGIGNDHAHQVLRKDVCEHLKLAHDEIGFKYVRFHGIFDDDMLCIQRLTDISSYKNFPMAERISEQNFRRVASVFDNVLECGLKPFVELSFMPSALASGDKTGLAYKNNITMPKDLAAWQKFISDFIGFLLARYGNDEVESWYFEVWNEPDLDLFFAGSKDDYLKFYEATAKAIRSVNKNLRVGGPSTSGCRWIEEFTAFCDKNNLPLDFVTTHHYPGDAFGNIVSKELIERMMSVAKECAENGVDMGDAITSIFFNPENYRTWGKGVFRELDVNARKEAGGKPLIITEWNSSATYSVPLHDEKYSSAFVIKSVLDAQDLTNGYMFWCCSDIFEETFDLGKPFHGSFGIINNDGIPKPNFWAFKILSELLPQRYDLPITNNDVEYSVFTDGKKLQLLVYAQDFDYQKDEEYSVDIGVQGAFSNATVQRIDSDHCNPKKEWIDLGKPDVLTANQATAIKQKTRLKKQDLPIKSVNGETKATILLHTNDVILIEFE